MTSAKSREVARNLYLSNPSFAADVDSRAQTLLPQVQELALRIATELALGIPVQVRIEGGVVVLMNPEKPAEWVLD